MTVVGVLACVGGGETELEADAVCSGAREVLLSLLGTAGGRVWWDLATAGYAEVERKGCRGRRWEGRGGVGSEQEKVEERVWTSGLGLRLRVNHDHVLSKSSPFEPVPGWIVHSRQPEPLDA